MRSPIFVVRVMPVNKAKCGSKLIPILALAIACERAPYEARRPWSEIDGSALEEVDAAGTTMVARRLPAGPGPHHVTLGEVWPGDVAFDVLIEGSAGAAAEVRLESEDHGGEVCRASGPSRWHPCRLPILTRTPAASLRVDVIAGSARTRVALSSPLVRARDAPARPPVFVMLMDTVRFDRLASYEPDVPLGANLAALGLDGIVFERAYSSSSWTRTAVATLLTGLDAQTHGVLGRIDVLPERFDSLPRLLNTAGYRTRAWSTNPNVLPIWGFAVGFDSFTDIGALAWNTDKTHAAEVFRAVRDDLVPPTTPAFYYIHLMDAHGPYKPGEADLAAVRADPALVASFPGPHEADEKIKEDYLRHLAEIRGMDREIGVFLDDLRQRDLYEQALILVVADHGEEFLDHGGLLHGSTLYEEMIRVPVILKLPGKALAGTRIRSEVGFVDLAPTLLGLLGLGPLADQDGRDLWDAKRAELRDEGAPQTALLELDAHHKAALVASERKLIVDYRGRNRLFDLHSDPRERRDLLPAAQVEEAALRALLDRRLAERLGGWHVRACGALKLATMEFGLRTARAARGSLMEEGDLLREGKTEEGADGREYEAVLQLRPRKAKREVFGKLLDELGADEDEIVVEGGGGALTVHATSERPLDYALGRSGERRGGEEIVLEPTDPAVVLAASDEVRCRDATTNYSGRPAASVFDPRPYLRIWYVPPPERETARDVDPAVQERLRALGYEW